MGNNIRSSSEKLASIRSQLKKRDLELTAIISELNLVREWLEEVPKVFEHAGISLLNAAIGERALQYQYEQEFIQRLFSIINVE